MVMVSIRVSEETHQRLRAIARREQRPMSSVADEAVRAYEKELRWEAAESAVARLKDNPAEWQDYQADVDLWDTTSSDGLDEVEGDRLA